MLHRLVQFSLRFRGIVLISALLLLGYGIQQTYHAKLDVFPEFVQPQVSVQTEAPGLSPEQVESLITLPLETAMMGLGNMEFLRSESIQGLSVITAVFKDGTDPFLARQILAEKIAEVGGRLGQSAKPPRLTPLTSSTMDLLKIGLVSEERSPKELRAFADWVLKPRLLAVPGVAKCSVFGGEVRQWQIQVLPDRLQAFGLSLQEVVAATRLATGVVGAGFIETENQRLLIQTEGQSMDTSSLGEVLVSSSPQGTGVRLKDVARVVDGVEPKFGDTLIQGKPGVLLTLSSQYGANTLEVTRDLEAALSKMMPQLTAQKVELFNRLHRPASFIESALKNIRHSLWLGGVLVAIVLLLFLGNLRAAVISITAIPLSLLTAVLVLQRLGISINTLTLGGLAIAIGEVVDDAIIDVENIVRRLRENSKSSNPKPVFRVVLEASLEVRTAVVYATFVVALVFLPVLTLTGIQGKFFAPLALSYILAILASLGVALTITPAMALLFFKNGLRSEHEPRLQNRLKQAYARLLQPLLHRPGWVIAFVMLICAASLLILPRLGGQFLPEFREGHFVLQVSMVPGTSLPEMKRLGGRISQALLAIPSIATVEQQIGRAELGEDPWGPHRSEFHVELKPVSSDEEKEVSEKIRTTLEGFPGIQFEVLTFLGDRIGETIAGETAPVVVNFFGPDLDQLDQQAIEATRLLKGIRGAADIQVKAPPGSPRIAIKLRHESLRALGFRPVEVLEAVQTAYQGTIVSQIYQGDRVADVAVTLEDRSRQQPEEVGSLLLRNTQGLRVPLRELADVYLTSGRHTILHDGARRRQTLTCNAVGRELGSFTREVEQTLTSRLSLPLGCYLVVTGAAEASRKASLELLLNATIAGVAILMLLSVVFRNSHNLLLVLVNIPFSMVGGILALKWIQHLGGEEAGGLTLGSLVGFVTLFGITTRNSIMLISHFDHLVAQENHPWNGETALQGALERLLPISMTALVTGLGLLPLALGAGEAGREIEGPMAIVILGGLITSTALNLLVLPVLALRFGRFQAIAPETR